MRFSSGRNTHTGFGGIAAVFRAAVSRSSGTLSLKIVYACVGLFVGIALLDLLGIVTRQQAFSFLGLSHYGVGERMWLHQFLTAPLLHGNLTHLLFNMLALWMLGPSVETILGRRRYLIFTLVCALTSMVAAYAVTFGSPSITLGYSGVIFGILVAQAVYYPDSTIIVFMFFPMRMRHAVLLFGAVALYLTVFSQGSGIAHAAHLFGALAAYVYLRILRRTSRPAKAKRPSQKPRPIVPRRGDRKPPGKIPDEL